MVLQISFLERNIYECIINLYGNSRVFEKLRYWSTREKWEKNMLVRKYSIFILFDFREHLKRISQGSSKAPNMTVCVRDT